MTTSYLYTATLRKDADLSAHYSNVVDQWGSCLFDGENCRGLERWMRQLHSFRGGDDETYQGRVIPLNLDERLLLIDEIESGAIDEFSPSPRASASRKQRVLDSLRSTLPPRALKGDQLVVYLPY